MSSPPPLRHPIPTHPTYIPEPPPTPVSPEGYQRYSSSPAPHHPQNPYQAHHVPAYSSPFQHPHIHSLPHLQQQTPQFPPPPDFTSWGMNDATAHFGMQLGHSAVAAGQEYVQRNFGTIFPFTALKHYFNVSNMYVMIKLRIIFFPWLHKPWTRRIRRSEQGQAPEWQSPRDDINSPDLYIPLMAVITYILLCALYAGFQKQFHTKVLGEASSRAFLMILFDFAFVKLGCYFLNVQGPSQVIDLIAYGGYKFVGVIFTIMFGFLHLPSAINTFLFFYVFLANAFFLLRSLRSVFLPDPAHQLAANPNPTSTATLTSSARRRRITFLFLEAVSQIVYMGILVRI